MIIFINGNLNSGKSTVSKLLAEKIGNCAIVEIDHLRSFISWMSIEDAVPLNWENAICVIQNFVKRGLHVIVPYPLNQQYYEFVQKELAHLEIPKYFITLAPNIDVLLTNRGARELFQEDIDRIKILYDRGIDNSSFAHKIDNSNSTPDQTLSEVMAFLRVT